MPGLKPCSAPEARKGDTCGEVREFFCNISAALMCTYIYVRYIAGRACGAYLTSSIAVQLTDSCLSDQLGGSHYS